MKNYQLTRHDTNEILFEGTFKDLKTCLETAVTRRIPLPHINLQGQNLSNANLDDGIFPYANFQNTNLTGANLSESHCTHANFNGSSLFNTCLAYSNVSDCDFRNCDFGATDINGAIIDRIQLSTLSAFTLNFSQARQMRDCVYYTTQNTEHQFSTTPITIHGLTSAPIVMINDRIIATQHHQRPLTQEQNAFISKVTSEIGKQRAYICNAKPINRY